MKRCVYDFDKTIYDGDATAHFFRHCARRYPRIALDFLFGSCWYFVGMGLGLIEKTRAKGRFYRFLRFVPDIEAELSAFWAGHAHRIKRWYLETHRPDDLIISASPTFLLEPICQTLRVELIASLVAPRTGKTLGPNCHGEEKVKRMRAVCPDIRIETFYSDARSDAPLAALAEDAFLVKGKRIAPW